MFRERRQSEQNFPPLRRLLREQSTTPRVSTFYITQMTDDLSTFQDKEQSYSGDNENYLVGTKQEEEVMEDVDTSPFNFESFVQESKELVQLITEISKPNLDQYEAKFKRISDIVCFVCLFVFSLFSLVVPFPYHD
jgi:hypothetical protein